MDKDVVLLLTGGLISLVSALLTSIVNHRLTKQFWAEQKVWEKQEEDRIKLTGSISELETLLREDVLGTLRGMGKLPEDEMLIPLEMGKLQISKSELTLALSKHRGDSIAIREVIDLSMETLAPDKD